jgi:hypothetical protein
VMSANVVGKVAEWKGVVFGGDWGSGNLWLIWSIFCVVGIWFMRPLTIWVGV